MELGTMQKHKELQNSWRTSKRIVSELLRWKDASDEQTKQILERLEGLIVGVKELEWERGELENIIMPEAEKLDNRGFMLWPMRAALTGKKASAGPFEVAEILGKEKTLQRIKQAVTLFEA